MNIGNIGPRVFENNEMLTEVQVTVPLKNGNVAN